MSRVKCKSGCRDYCKADGLCANCYQYRRIHGENRPQKFIDDHDANDYLPVDERIRRAKEKVKQLGLGR